MLTVTKVSNLAEIRWTTSDEIRISEQSKYLLDLPESFPFNIRFYEFETNCKLIPSFHDYNEIIYVFEGEGSIYIENYKYEIKKNDIVLVNNNELHRLETRADEKIKVISVYFNPLLVTQPLKYNLGIDYLTPFYCSGRNLNRYVSGNEKVTDKLLKLITNMYDEWNTKDKYFELAIKNNLQEIMLIILRYSIVENSFARIEIPIHHLDMYKEVLSFVSKNYNKRISNTHCASLMNISTSYFCRLFKKNTGMPLTEYIHRYRVEQSKHLLIKNELSISQIAYETGFENLGYYDRIFQRYIKMSPKEYQEYVNAHYT